jgi:hypothetical protein
VSLEDTDPPALIGVDFNPKAVDVTDDPAPVVIEIELSDDLSGVEYANCNFVSQSGQKHGGCFFGSPISGNRNDGVYSCTWTVPQFTEAGIWRISTCGATDQGFNSATWSSADLESRGFPTGLAVVSTEDTEPPALIDFDFNPKAIDLTADAAQINFEMELSDALAGVSTAGCGMVSQSGRIYIGAGKGFPTSGDRNNGIFTFWFSIPRYYEEGIWHIDSCHATDQLFNEATWSLADLTALALPTDLYAGFLPGTPSAAISTLMHGKRVRGNSFTIKADLLRGSPDEVSPTLGVRFDMRPLPAGSFAPIPARYPNHPNPDTRYPYFTHWDVSSVADGDYELRAVAHDLGGLPDPTPETITITIDRTGVVDIDENFTAEDIQESRAAVEDGVANYVASGDPTDAGTAAELIVPVGALTSPTDTAILSFPDPAGEEPLLDSADQSIGAFVSLEFQSGQTSFEDGYRVDLLVSYPDYDQDGYVDGTDVRESDLELRHYDPVAGTYVPYLWTVLTEHNMVYSDIPFTGRFAVVPKPLRWPSLARAQQACVNEMNKNGEKVNRAQLKENERCLMDFQKEKLVAPMTFDICMTADRKGKVQKAEERTASREGVKCDPLDVPPPSAYTNAATVNAAAVDGALALTYAIFGGPPVLNADLVTKADNKDAAKCQLEMLKRADKLENTVLKELNRAKRKAFRDETVNSDVALEARLRAVLSSNHRVTRTQDSLVRRVDRKCAVLQAPPDAIFPGECGEGSPNLAEVEVCVISKARCEACSKINAFDDLDLDCDQADDQTANASCP